MPSDIQGAQFRDEQSASRYPFADTATLVDDLGNVLPADLFADATLYPIGGVEGVYLSQLSVAVDGQITLGIGDVNTALMASVTFDPLIDAPLLLLDLSGRPAGVIVLDPLQAIELQGWQLGTYTFSQEATEFVAACVIPTPEIGVRGLQSPDGYVATGDVWLIGENGVVLREVDGYIRIDIVGDPLFRRRLCESLDLFVTPAFVKTINGIGPNQYGSFNFMVVDEVSGDTLLRLSPVNDNQLRITAIGQLAETGT